MGKDYFVPFADFGEDKFEEKRSKFTEIGIASCRERLFRAV